MTISRTLYRQTAVALLILVMLFTWVGHLFTQSVTVHALDNVSQVEETHSHSHDHDAQSFHQTAGIGHQHPPLSPDHLHETPQLPLITLSTLPRLAESQPQSLLADPPAAPLFRIERPPRRLS